MLISDARKILGVKASDDEAAIKAAFRRLAMEHHPDRNGGSEEAARKFKQISAAHTVLQNHLKTPHAKPLNSEPVFDDIFENMYRRGRGRPSARAGFTHIRVSVTLQQALKGGKATASLGFVQYQAQIPPFTAAHLAAGYREIIDYEKGILITATLEPDSRFTIVDRHIVYRIELPWWKALKGSEITVPSPKGGMVTAVIDKAIMPGQDHTIAFPEAGAVGGLYAVKVRLKNSITYFLAMSVTAALVLIYGGVKLFYRPVTIILAVAALTNSWNLWAEIAIFAAASIWTIPVLWRACWPGK